MHKSKRSRHISSEKQKAASASLKLQPESFTSIPKRKMLLTMLFLFVISFVLNCIGINWGLPNSQPWHSDSIAGLKTVSQMPNLFGPWKHKYPRFHFLINSAFYKPFLEHWRKNPVLLSASDGQPPKASVLDIHRISRLIIISNVISAFMGAGTVLMVFLSARLLFNDYLAGVFAGLSLAVSQLFVFYSHLGNLDTPTTFWFAVSLYFAIKATYIAKWRHFILLGLFCALAVCTKDYTGAYVVGLGIAVWLAMSARAKNAGQTLKRSVLYVFNKKVLLAVIIAAFCFALLSDLLTTPSAFIERMRFYAGESGVPFYQTGFRGQLPLISATFWNFYYALGWPLFLVVIVSVFYGIIKFGSKSAFVLAPLIIFYLLVITRIRFSYDRFFIPAFTGLMLFAGKFISDWLRWQKVSFLIRIIPLVFVYALSALYCLGIDLEMISDSRCQAEKWFAKNVDRNIHVAALCPATYAPRLDQEGFSYSLRCSWTKLTSEEQLRKEPAYPEYIIMSEKWYTDGKFFDQKFRQAIFDGSLGYKEVVHFENKYLYPKRTIFGFAGWPRPLYDAISPDVIVLKRQ